VVHIHGNVSKQASQSIYSSSINITIPAFVALRVIETSQHVSGQYSNLITDPTYALRSV